MDYKKLKEILYETPHLSPKGLAKALGKSQGTVSKILNGKRPIKIHEIPIIERYLGGPINNNAVDKSPQKVVLINVMGTVQHNIWVDSTTDGAEFSEVPSITGLVLPGGKQVAYAIAQKIENYIPGQYLICSKHIDMQPFVEIGRRVVATLRKGDLTEIGVYIVNKSSSGQTVLRKLDTTENYSMDELEINGIVLACITPEIPLAPFQQQSPL